MWWAKIRRYASRFRLFLPRWGEAPTSLSSSPRHKLRLVCVFAAVTLYSYIDLFYPHCKWMVAHLLAFTNTTVPITLNLNGCKHASLQLYCCKATFILFILTTNECSYTSAHL